MGGFASLITSIIGGIQSRNAAHDAAGAINDAANKAAGGATSAADAGNTQIQKATDAGVTGVNAAAGSAGAGAVTAAKAAGAGVNAATGEAVAALKPYTDLGTTAAGELNTGLAAGGEFNKMPTLADLQMDPGYGFREQQGEQAIARHAAAFGGLQSGGFAKDLTTFAQGSASQEYQNAFARFEANRSRRFGELAGGAGVGYDAASRTGTDLTRAAEYSGDKGYGASVFAGTAGLEGSEFGAKMGFEGAKSQAVMRNAAAEYAGNMTLRGGEATAAGDIGAAGAWNAMLKGMGGVYDNAAAQFTGVTP